MNSEIRVRAQRPDAEPGSTDYLNVIASKDTQTGEIEKLLVSLRIPDHRDREFRRNVTDDSV